MPRVFRLFACMCLLPATVLHSQLDSARAIPLVGIHISGQLPSGDLGRRFGPNLAAGGAVAIKTKKNWVFAAEASYLFGRNVREDVTKNLKNPEGFIVDNEGFPADLRVSERGIEVHGSVGRVFSLFSANKNSGLLVMIGAGYLQHQVYLYDAQRKVAGIAGDLRRGYDRLTGGFSVSQFVGYLFLGEHHMVNFYFGFEAYEAFTKSYRKMNYSTGEADTRQRTDILNGFRAGWILPIYKKKPDDFYYD